MFTGICHSLRISGFHTFAHRLLPPLHLFHGLPENHRLPHTPSGLAVRCRDLHVPRLLRYCAPPWGVVGGVVRLQNSDMAPLHPLPRPNPLRLFFFTIELIADGTCARLQISL